MTVKYLLHTHEKEQLSCMCPPGSCVHPLPGTTAAATIAAATTTATAATTTTAAAAAAATTTTTAATTTAAATVIDCLSPQLRARHP